MGKKNSKHIALLSCSGMAWARDTKHIFTFFLSLLVCRLNSLISFGASPPEVAPRDFVTCFGCVTDLKFLTRTVMPSFCAYKSKIGRYSDKFWFILDYTFDWPLGFQLSNESKHFSLSVTPRSQGEFSLYPLISKWDFVHIQNNLKG